MNRPASGLLREIDPDTLAADIESAVLNHVGSLGLELSPRYTLRVDEAASTSYTQIGEAVRRLARYACHGTRLDASVHEYLISLIPLYSAVYGDTDVDGIQEDADPTTALGAVIAAAVAREALSIGEAITTARLAVLASITPHQIRHLGREGEIAIADGRIAADECARWLGARGVAGFGS